MARRFFLFATLVLSLALVASAEESYISGDIANSRNKAIAQINSDGVYIRSGPGDNYYPTTKLNKGAEVTVVGEKFDWLKIVPPQGSFCYVAKAFIDKNADGSAASNRDDVNVRAGSELNTIKTSVQTKLSNGAPVTILGEVDEYYKIAPPQDAYVYVKKDYVEPKKVIPSAGASSNDVAKRETASDGSTTAVAGATTQPSSPNDLTTPTNPVAKAASTQPSGDSASAEATFDKLEAQFNETSKLPIDKQPLAQMTADYQKLLADPNLPESMKRIVDFHMQTLKVRSAAQADFVAVNKQQEEAKQKQVAMKAEQEEIAQQIKEKDVKVYAAVGTLRTSSLQQGNTLLYRLTDPQTGRTVCYIRSDDAKYGQMLGQFIGVKGAISSDPGLNLKVVTPTEYSNVDPNQLYRGVAAQIVPPSLLPQAAQQASASEK